MPSLQHCLSAWLKQGSFSRQQSRYASMEPSSLSRKIRALRAASQRAICCTYVRSIPHNGYPSSLNLPTLIMAGLFRSFRFQGVFQTAGAKEAA